jgi:hypothetical protein
MHKGSRFAEGLKQRGMNNRSLKVAVQESVRGVGRTEEKTYK